MYLCSPYFRPNEEAESTGKYNYFCLKRLCLYIDARIRGYKHTIMECTPNEIAMQKKWHQ